METSFNLPMANENVEHLHHDTIQLWREMKSCMLLITGQKRSLWVKQPKSLKTNTESSFLLEAPISKSSGVSTYPGEVGKSKETTAGEQRREWRRGKNTEWVTWTEKWGKRCSLEMSRGGKQKKRGGWNNKDSAKVIEYHTLNYIGKELAEKKML